MFALAVKVERSDGSFEPMRRARNAVPSLTNRRAVLVTACAALTLPRHGPSASCGASYLELLLRRRDELLRVVAEMDLAADRLKRGGLPSMRRRLRAMLRAQTRANQALDRLEWVIAETPAKFLGDVALKLRLCAELQGYAGTAGSAWREPFTAEEQLLRAMIVDLERLRRQHEGRPWHPDIEPQPENPSRF